VTAAPALKLNVTQIFKEITEDVSWLNSHQGQRDKKIVHLANNIFLVQKHMLYKQKINPQTNKPYRSFTSWLSKEVNESRASVYRFLSAREYLQSIPNETLEKIGNMKCFELAKIGRDKPKLLPRFIREIEKHPEMQVVSLKSMVDNVIAGGKFDSGEYESMNFVVKVEDVQYVQKALAVLQAMEAVKNPESASGRGVHLVSLCQEFLSGGKESKILKALEEAGAFDNSPFKIEEE
jgi:hypothetical protein